MDKLETVNAVVYKTLFNMSEDTKKKILHHSIFYHWRKMVGGPLAASVLPLKIENKILYLYSNNASARDNVKYLAQNIVDKINEEFGGDEKIVEKIAFGKSFEQPSEKFVRFIEQGDKPKKISPEEKIREDLRKINLTDEEIAECEKKVEGVKDDERRKIFLKTFIAKKKAEKWKLSHGWHKCLLCDLLCEPREILCCSCHIHEREKMYSAIRKIFSDVPWTPYKSVIEEVSEKMPHMKKECTVDAVDFARTSLIQQVAGGISFGDTTSLNAKFLVMLVKQIDGSKLTEALIAKTLYEMRFSLADRFTERSVETENSLDKQKENKGGQIFAGEITES